MRSCLGAVCMCESDVGDVKGKMTSLGLSQLHLRI